MYAYDVYRMATPARNPERDSYWTPIYSDAGGAGWMVSHAAPVYVADAFAGMVGTDILLDFLSAALSRQHRPPGRAWIVDDRGVLLADSARLAPRAAEAPSIAAALPEAIAALPLTELLEPSTMPRKSAAGRPWHCHWRHAMAPGVRCRRGRNYLARSCTAVALCAAAEWRAGNPGHCPASAAAILRRARDRPGWSCTGSKQRRARAVTAKSA